MKTTEVSTSSGLPSEKMEKNDRLVGYALYYYTYSTWNGRALYVEDLFVREENRGRRLVASHTLMLYLSCHLLQARDSVLLL